MQVSLYYKLSLGNNGYVSQGMCSEIVSEDGGDKNDSIG